MTDAPANYALAGGVPGRERLRLLSRVMGPTTASLLDEVTLPPAARCLDLGCGGGDVSLAMARRVPDGTVVGIDLDATKLDQARAEAAAAGAANVTYRRADATALGAEQDERYDLVYARFLLSHLPDPEAVLGAMVERLAPGGALAVEDVEIGATFCHPDHPAMSRSIELYKAAVRARGADPDIGPRLPGMARRAGFRGIGVHIVQPAGLEGEVKLLQPLTLEIIRDAIVSGGLAESAEVDRLVAELYDLAARPDTLVSVPRIVQVWGVLAPS